MNECKVKNCSNKIYVKNYCQRHYQQIRRYNKIISIGRSKFDPNKFEFIKENCLIHLYDERGNYKNTTIINLKDYELIKNYKWHLNNTTGYVATTKNGKKMLLHNLIMNTLDIDHIDRNKLNNKRNNLRPATKSQNGMNRIKQTNNTSGFKGVFWNKYHKKWQAQITRDKKQIYLGYFNNKIEAGIAYNNAAIKYFGQFARLNEI